jgi:hypothetical protein
MNRHRAFLAFLGVEAALLVTLFGLAQGDLRRHRLGLRAETTIGQRLQLTDLALWTEARYTRHPSQADFFSPFQDFPSAIDHFPAGSLIAPPGRGRGGR